MVNMEKAGDTTMQVYLPKIQAFNRKIAEGGWQLEFSDKQLVGLMLVGLPAGTSEVCIAGGARA